MHLQKLVEHLLVLFFLQYLCLVHLLLVNTVFHNGSLEVFARESRGEEHFVIKHGSIYQNGMLKVKSTIASLELDLRDMLVDLHHGIILFFEQLFRDCPCKSFRNRLGQVFVVQLLLNGFLFFDELLFVVWLAVVLVKGQVVLPGDQVKVVKHYFLKLQVELFLLDVLAFEKSGIILSYFGCLYIVPFLLQFLLLSEQADALHEVNFTYHLPGVLFELVEQGVHFDHELSGQQSVFFAVRRINLEVFSQFLFQILNDLVQGVLFYFLG